MHQIARNSERIFLTGAAGFIGANLLRRLLQEKKSVHILLKQHTDTWRIADLLSDQNLHLHIGTLTDEGKLLPLLLSISPQVIYHCAARGAYSDQDNVEEIFSTNTIGTLHLLEAARHFPLQLFVFTGSSSEYGTPVFHESENSFAMQEKQLCQPDSLYAVSKLAASHLCQQYARQFDVPTIVLRLFSVYGPWERPSRLLPTLLSAAESGNSVEMAEPETVRDFIYVDDVVELCLQVEKLKKQVGNIFNVGTGVQTNLAKVCETVEKITQKSLQIHWHAFPSKRWDKQHWYANMKETHETLQWKASESFESGLQKMWEWQLARSKAIKK